jgi:hypothetical protein
MSTELASMAYRNISEFFIDDRTSSRELRQSAGVRVTETAVLERCGGNNSSKGVVCERMRISGRKTDGVQWPGAITPDDHIPGSKILHRYVKWVKFH